MGKQMPPLSPETLPPDLDDLPSFAVVRPETHELGGCWDFWNVTTTGDPALDQARGRVFAAEAIECAARQQHCAPIAFALCAIAERGEVGNVEAGFLVRIAEAARSRRLS